MTPQRLMSLAAAKGITFDSIPGGGPPRWTARDAAHAIAGLPIRLREPCYAAFAYRWAGDDTQRSKLYAHLMMEVVVGWAEVRNEHGVVIERARLSLSEIEQWPSRIREQKYMERLIRLAILEERYWFVIRKAQLWSQIIAEYGFRDMDEHVWHKRMSRKYEAIRDVIDGWCAIVGYHVSARIAPRDNDETVACA